MLGNSKLSVITNEDIVAEKADFPFEITIFNAEEKLLFNTTTLSKNKTINTCDTTSIAKYKFDNTNDYKEILGYRCKKATTVINSNTIEVWFTNALNMKASPSIIGIDLGVVLEINRNNTFTIRAAKIEKTKQEFPKIPNIKNCIDKLTYNDLVWKSKFNTIPIFENEVINFSEKSTSNDSILRFANGTVIVKKIQFPKLSSSDLTFIDVTEQSNGDAYDRTGSVFIIPQDKTDSFLNGMQNGTKTLPIYTNGNGKEYQGVVATESYNPPIELLRFFTPFGIAHYNYIELKGKDWFNKAFYRQDISELNSYLSEKELYIGCFIGNYDKGGHKVSINLTLHKEENIVKENTTILPLFNTTNVLEMAGQNYGSMFDNENGLQVIFTLEKPIKNAKLRYITTGHGGWENGDEFVPKENSIYLDGKLAYNFTPWRQDCGSFRLYNPASGNFSNGLSSSDYSRANWCPGMATNPVYIALGNLEAGTHTLQVKIPQGQPEGNSFSYWNVSGVLIGN
ncbi:MAG: PNGase F N-terminal domain-containing protein [Flavobacterium sp.]